MCSGAGSQWNLARTLVMCRGINLAGSLGDAEWIWIQKACSGQWKGVPFSSRRGMRRALCPLPTKMNFSLEMACFGAFWAVFFCPCPCQKNVEFSAWSADLVDVEDVLLGSNEYSVRIMGLISFLLHYCIVMQAIWCLKIWNMTKSGEDNLQ